MGVAGGGGDLKTGLLKKNIQLAAQIAGQKKVQQIMLETGGTCRTIW